MKSPMNAAMRPSTTSRKRINSKQKGNVYERWLARFFREKFGFRFCRTSREASRLLDNCGVDLSGIPYCISAKTGYRQNRPKAEAIIAQVKQKLQENFPAQDAVHTYPVFLLHKLDGRSPFHHLVTMTFDDWVRIMTIYEKFKMYENERQTETGGITGTST